MDLKTCYEAMGSDYADVTQRLPSERLIRKLLLKFPEDPSFRDLTQALETGDRATAFRSAHNLKGVCLNLSFSTLLHSASAVTEALREGTQTQPDTLQALYEDLRRDYERVLQAIRDLTE